MINTMKKIRAVIRDHRQKRFISYKDAILNWYSTRNNNYKIYNLGDVKELKTSDTIFVLATGPSLNQLNSDHIKMIERHDSIGVSLSFLKKELTPTFLMPPMESADPICSKLRQDIFSPYRKQYNNVIIFINKKALFRMVHPRLTPYLFPEEAKCFYFCQTEGIQLEKKRPFNDSDFGKSLRYRGKLTAVLDLVSKLDYKNIVLLGVDLDKWSYFYENMGGKVAEHLKNTYAAAYGVEHVTEKNKKYVGMYPKAGKYNTLDEYLYALRAYLKRKKDVNLFVGFKNNMLHPEIPAYFD